MTTTFYAKREGPPWSVVGRPIVASNIDVALSIARALYGHHVTVGTDNEKRLSTLRYLA